MDFKTRLKKLREKKGITQAELGKLFNLSKQAISSYEKGGSTPPPDKLDGLASLFNVTTDYLLGRSEHKYNFIYDSDFEDEMDDYLVKLTSHLTNVERTRGMSPKEYNTMIKLVNILFINGRLADYSTLDPKAREEVIDLLFSKVETPKVRLTPVFTIEGVDIPRSQEILEGNTNKDLDPLVYIPVLGTIKAGYDSIAQQEVIGHELVPREAVQDGEYFFLLVTGDSMIEDGIRDGFRVLVKHQNFVENGKIGVVIVNGDEGTLKRVFYQDGMVILQAGNKNIPPRIVRQEDIRIQGQVTKVEFDV